MICVYNFLFLFFYKKSLFQGTRLFINLDIRPQLLQYLSYVVKITIILEMFILLQYFTIFFFFNLAYNYQIPLDLYIHHRINNPLIIQRGKIFMIILYRCQSKHDISMIYRKIFTLVGYYATRMFYKFDGMYSQKIVISR